MYCLTAERGNSAENKNCHHDNPHDQCSKLFELKKKIEELQARVNQGLTSRQDSLYDKTPVLGPSNLRVEPLSLIRRANQNWARKPRTEYNPKLDPNNVAFYKPKNQDEMNLKGNPKGKNLTRETELICLVSM